LTPKRLYNFMLDPELAEALKALKARDGVSEAEIVRRGIKMYVESRGIKVKSERKRAATRKRS
jgi:hypothetical protein